MAEAPRILLEHHLKRLKLPTFLREHEKLARQCAAEGLDHVQFLARLVELELIDRERRLVERRIKQAGLPIMGRPWPSDMATDAKVWRKSWMGATAEELLRRDVRDRRAGRAAPHPATARGRPVRRSRLIRVQPWRREDRNVRPNCDN